jgi:tRNA A-37 threonylcarbamoyl transferase component Bud32
MTDCEDRSDLAETLDHYVESLQSGRAPDRKALLEKHPELESLLASLEALERLAPAGTPRCDADAQSPAGDEAALPRELGDYELLGEVGRGGMGVVFRARQKSLQRVVALKMILANHLASTDHVRRFHDEARAAAGLRHPNIVQIHDVGQSNGLHFFTMEYVEGDNLAVRLARAPLDRTDAVRLIAKVARAVQHLHEHHVIHRDLKPSNILLDADGGPHVTDFGLAKCLTSDSQATATGVIAGTACYMAPEQATGRSATLGPACDIYSLGAIIYELLTGRPPFLEDSPLDTLLQVLGGEPVPPRRLDRRIPRDLERICLKCLARTPADRYPSALSLADDLERFLRGETLEAQPPGLFRRLWTWGRREPALASRVAVLTAFYAVDLVNLALDKIDVAFHIWMSAIIAVWLVGSFVLQQWYKSVRGSIPARFVWGLLDSSLLLAALLCADGAASPLVVGYFLLIVAAGLWSRVRFVWVMTGLSLISYSILIVDYYQWRPEELQKVCSPAPDRHVIFMLALVATAGVVAYLVGRLRALSSYLGYKI